MAFRRFARTRVWYNIIFISSDFFHFCSNTLPFVSRTSIASDTLFTFFIVILILAAGTDNSLKLFDGCGLAVTIFTSSLSTRTHAASSLFHNVAARKSGAPQPAQSRSGGLRAGVQTVGRMFLSSFDLLGHYVFDDHSFSLM